MTNIELVEKRRSGQTTGIVMEAIGQVMKTGKHVQIEDHAVKNPQGAKLLMNVAQDVLDKLGFSDQFVLERRGSSLVIMRSHITTAVFVSKCGRAFKETC